MEMVNNAKPCFGPGRCCYTSRSARTPAERAKISEMLSDATPGARYYLARTGLDSVQLYRMKPAAAPLGKLGNKALYIEYLKLDAEYSALNTLAIDHGFGHRTAQDMRDAQAAGRGNWLFARLIAVMDETSDIREEAERRLGPDGLFQLRYC